MKGWRNLSLDCSEDFPSFFRLLSIILPIPLSTVYCERGFSYINLGKNKLRSKLTEDNLDYTLRIMLEGDCLEEMDSTQSLEIWKNEAIRTTSPYT